MEYDRYKASSLRSYNGRFGERYDSALEVRIFGPGHLDDWILDRLGPRLRGRSILDVGCGTGRLLERLARAGADRLAGADLAEKVLEIAGRKLRDTRAIADLKVADAETELPWDDGSFSVVTMTGALHHFLHPEAVLREIKRVLRGDGTLLLGDVCFRPLLREAMNLWMRIRPHHGDCHFRTPRIAMELLRENGWRTESWNRIRWWGFGVVGVPASHDSFLLQG